MKRFLVCVFMCVSGVCVYILEGSVVVVVVFFSRAGSTFHEQQQIIDFYLFWFSILLLWNGCCCCLGGQPFHKTWNRTHTRWRHFFEQKLIRECWTLFLFLFLFKKKGKSCLLLLLLLFVFQTNYLICVNRNVSRIVPTWAKYESSLFIMPWKLGIGFCSIVSNPLLYLYLITHMGLITFIVMMTFDDKYIS